MSDVDDSFELTPNAVVAGLLTLSRRLDELTAQVDATERDAVNAREDYTLAYAKEFLKAEGAMDIRRYVATENTHVVRLAAELAEAKVRGLKRQVDSLKVRIEVGRSAAALVRSEAELLRVSR